MDTNCIGYNVDVSGCSPEVIKAITQTLSRVKEDLQKVQEIQQKIDILMEIYQVGKPFVPYIKAAMEEKGIIENAASSFPFPEVTAEDRKQINEIMQKAGV